MAVEGDEALPGEFAGSEALFLTTIGFVLFAVSYVDVLADTIVVREAVVRDRAVAVLEPVG